MDIKDEDRLEALHKIKIEFPEEEYQILLNRKENELRYRLIDVDDPTPMNLQPILAEVRKFGLESLDFSITSRMGDKARWGMMREQIRRQKEGDSDE